MQLYLDSFGAFLSVRNGMFNIRTRTAGEQSFAVRQVDAILLTKGTGMSTDAALLAVENDIPVLLIDANTHFPKAQVSSGKPGSIASIRKNQAVFVRTGDGYAWVAAQIAGKIEAQRALLRQLTERPDAPAGFAGDVALTDRVMASLEQEFRNWKPPVPGALDPATMDTIAGRFRGQEGTASRLYFQQLSKYLGGRLEFTDRQKRPAYDPFNVLLNYLYGMLYTQVHLAMLKSGLDPYMGVLHADQYGGRPTLVFDAIEPWRPWADQVAVGLADGRLLQADDFETYDRKEGLWLSGPGKSTIIDAMLDFLQDQSAYDGRNVRRSVQIDLEAQKLAVFLKEFE
jgi:CRISPR-associated protein Cas1